MKNEEFINKKLNRIGSDEQNALFVYDTI